MTVFKSHNIDPMNRRCGDFPEKGLFHLSRRFDEVCNCKILDEMLDEIQILQNSFTG